MRSVCVLFVCLFVLAGCAVQAPYADWTDAGIRNLSDKQLVDAINRGSAIGQTWLPGAEANRAQSRRLLAEMKRRYPDWDWRRIESGTMWVGMTDLQLRLSWGPPVKINRASYGDQWVYEFVDLTGRVYRRQYAYVRDGVVTSWN